MKLIIFLSMFSFLAPNLLVGQNYSLNRTKQEIARTSYKKQAQAQKIAHKKKALVQRSIYKKKAKLRKMKQKQRALARKNAYCR